MFCSPSRAAQGDDLLLNKASQPSNRDFKFAIEEQSIGTKWSFKRVALEVTRVEISELISREVDKC